MEAKFQFSCFVFTIKAKTVLHLPRYKGSALRGGFGHAFRQAVCASRQRKPCTECLLKHACAYSWVFETPVPDDSSMMRKYPSAPHPFILDPPATMRQNFKVNECLDFQITLIGKAVEHLPYFIYAFERFGHNGIGRGRGKFDLIKVVRVPVDKPSNEHEVPVFEGEARVFKPPDRPNRWMELLSKPPPERLTLRFLTPTRLKFKGHFTKDLEFHILFRNLLRRITLLAYFHCDKKLDDTSYRNLIKLAHNVKTRRRDVRWIDWQRWSSRQNTRMKLGGLIGEIEFEGDFEPFWPYIRLGEYVHVGKGSSFGLGRYEVKLATTDLS